MQLFYFLLLICSFAYADDVKLSEAEIKIVGGSNAAIENFPYVAALQYSVLGILWTLDCAGTLISANSVLTAAHCFEGRPPSSWRVRLGSSIAAAGSNIDVTRGVIHSDYDPLTLDFDVAILRLAARTPLSENVQLAWLAGRSFNLDSGAVVTALGWGNSQAGGSGSIILQEVDLDVVSQQICVQQYTALAGSRQVTPRMLCAGTLGGGRGTCDGDDGGPIILKGPNVDAVVGITSWRYQCADSQYPEVHIRISEVIDWIIERTLFM